MPETKGLSLRKLKVSSGETEMEQGCTQPSENNVPRTPGNDILILEMKFGSNI
jgi:hypothetical protein